jgi:ribosomal protein S6
MSNLNYTHYFTIKFNITNHLIKSIQTSSKLHINKEVIGRLTQTTN